MSLGNLGASDIILHGPYDTNRVRFSIPANWLLTDGAELTIKASAYFAGPASSESAASDYLGALLDVYFNGDLQQSIPLIAGSDIIYRVPIKYTALPSPRPDGSLEISFFLNAAIDCDYEFHKTTVEISSESQLALPFSVVPLKTDLRRLPWPLYQPGMNEQVVTSLVIPDQPTTDELQGAMLVMAALGRMTAQKLPVSLITVSEFTEQVRNENNVIFVGKAAGLTLLTGYDLPIPVSNAHFSAVNMQDDDGVIQITTSPWNLARAYLIIGGNSDDGVVKAAKAFTTENLQVGDTPASTVIAEVNPISEMGIRSVDASPSASPDVTLTDLGYSLETQSNLGANWFTYQFVIPPGQVPSETPYLNIVFSHSALVDVERSGIVIFLNGDLVGSTSFDESNTNYVSAHIDLPATNILPGRNVIDVNATLIPTDVCSVFSSTNLWMTMYPESLLHLPLAPSTMTGTELKELRDYPAPFTNDPNLSLTTMVLPSSDRAAWKTAGSIAYNIGQNANAPILNLEVVYAGAIADMPAGQNLIVIGKPADLPLIPEMGDKLPARFDAGSNMATLTGQNVVYRFPANKSLGFLELLSAPWDQQLTVMTVLGTDDVGLGFAGNGLIDSKMRGTLRGNFAIIDNEQTSVVDTRTGQGLGRVPVDIGPAVVTVQETPAPESVLPIAPTNENQQSILTAIYLVVGLMIVVVVVALILRKRISPPRP